MKITIPPLALHPGQQAILADPSRYRVIAAGRRFGKTLLAIEWLALEAGGALDGHPVAFFSPTYKLLLDVWSDLERTLKPVTRKANKTEMRIELTTGGKVDFWTLEDPDAGRGRKYARIVIDEAAHARNLQVAWERAIAPTLTDLEGEAWFISTPNGLNYFHALFQRGDDAARSDWSAHHMPSTVNPHLPAEELTRAQSDLPALVFAQEYLAEFVTFGAGLVKPEYLQDGPCAADLPVVLGVDLAISEREGADWTAIVALSRDPASGRIYVREVERHRAGFREVLARIEAAAQRWQPALIAIEQTQYQAAVVQELARSTKWAVRGVKPDRDKVTRFAPLLTRYEQRLVWHDPARVPAWFREELLAFPEGVHDDGCFVAGTPIFTANGLVAIENIKPGDAVFTRQGLRRVIDAGMTAPLAYIYRLEIDGGLILEGTRNHPVMTPSGWRNLGDLQDCDIIIVHHSIKATGNDTCHNPPRPSNTEASSFTARRGEEFTALARKTGAAASEICTSKSGSMLATRFQSIIEWFTSMATRTTTALKTWLLRKLHVTSSLEAAFTGGLVSQLSTTGSPSIAIQSQNAFPIANTLLQGYPTASAESIYSIGRSGRMFMGQFLMAIKSTTRTAILETTPWRILSWFRLVSTRKSISPSNLSVESHLSTLSISKKSGQWLRPGMLLTKESPGTKSTAKKPGAIASFASSCALNAVKILKRVMVGRLFIAQTGAIKSIFEKLESTKITSKLASIAERSSWESREVATVRARVRCVIAMPKKRPVFNLKVEGEHEYFANGILVHNCDAAAYAFAAAAQAGPIEFTPLPGTAPGWRRRPEDDLSHYDRAPGAW